MSRFLKLYELLAAGRPPRSADPMQRPGLFVPDLTSRAWHDASAFAWCKDVEAAAPAIREEVLRLRSGPASFVPYLEPARPLPGTTEWGLKALHDRGSWDVLYFDLAGRSFAANKEACPVTASVLSAVPRITTSSMFSALAPGSHIPSHCGPSNAFLRVHLGLVVPEGCAMRVGRETRGWAEGKCLVFDDSFEHEVWNRGRETRIVLIFYVYHPEFADAEVEELSLLREEVGLGEEDLWKRIADDMLAGRYPLRRVARA